MKKLSTEEHNKIEKCWKDFEIHQTQKYFNTSIKFSICSGILLFIIAFHGGNTFSILILTFLLIYWGIESIKKIDKLSSLRQENSNESV